MKTFFIIPLLIIIISCSTNKLSDINLCKNGKQVEIFNDKKIFSKNNKKISIYFDTGFNSNVKLMINHDTIVDTLIKTSPVSEPIFLHYSYKKSNDKQILKIKTDIDCLEIELDKSYSILGLYNYSNKWTLSYRKEFPIFE